MDDDRPTAVTPVDDTLFGDVAGLIDDARQRVAAAVNSELVMLYWSVGKRVREDVLGGERGAYGQHVIGRLAERLTARYGRGWSRQNLLQMLQFESAYPVAPIVQTPSGRLS